MWNHEIRMTWTSIYEMKMNGTGKTFKCQKCSYLRGIKRRMVIFEATSA